MLFRVVTPLWACTGFGWWFAQGRSCSFASFSLSTRARAQSECEAGSCGPSTMTEMPNDVLTELITAIVAARADGDGVLTIAAVRARLEAAKLYVARVEDERTGSEDFSALAS